MSIHDDNFIDEFAVLRPYPIHVFTICRVLQLYILFSNQADSNNLDTFASGAYAKFGNWLVVWWDGNPANPPVE